jgi:hypothetical protein
MRQAEGQPVLTEADLRAALATLERHAPELDAVLGVLPAISTRRRRPWPGPRLAVRARPLLLGGGLAMAAAAAAAGLVIVATGMNPGPAQPPHHAGLTASMVRHVATATKTAMASSGHVVISYYDVSNGVQNLSGTLDITFSGQNFNSVSEQPGTKAFTERVVGGQIYTYGDPPPGRKLQWYHSVNETSQGQEPVPDPRGLLFSLRPGAGFVLAGWQILGGLRLEQLRATDLHGLASAGLALGMKLPTYGLTSLNVWIDGRGVVRQMAMRFQDSGRSGTLYAQRFLVRFLDIGLAQTIKAPAHYASQRTYG